MNRNLKIIWAIFMLIGTQYSNAQGCSDAGFCSVGNPFKATNQESKNQFEFSFIIGKGEEDVFVFSPYVSYTRVFSNRFAMSAKLTSNVANGSFGTRGSLGDVFLTSNYVFNPSKYDKLKWSGILGLKIPLTQGNDKINNVSLPMPYQASLGTFDIITGVEASLKKWDFNIAGQFPLNDNKNSYLSSLSPTDKFISTNLFHRQPDVLFRSTYKVLLLKEKLTIKPNVLFIYHLGNDSFVDQFNKKVTINDSDGLTINGNVIANYKLSSNSSIETSLATPFVVRKVRPDGLTRSFTFGLTYKQSF